MVRFDKVSALFLLGLGIFLLTQVSLPYFSFKARELSSNLASKIKLINPTPNSKSVVGVSIKKTSDSFPAIVSDRSRATKSTYQRFQLSIPKINLYNVQVVVDSNDIEKSLAHLPGSALPGEKGNVFISGHSSGLLSFLRNDFYKSIFTQLPKLKVGDEIAVLVEGQAFHYEVSATEMTSPTDLSVIEPPDPYGRYLSLMTCIPPGVNTKRLIVIGKLKS